MKKLAKLNLLFLVLQIWVAPIYYALYKVAPCLDEILYKVTHLLCILIHGGQPIRGWV